MITVSSKLKKLPMPKPITEPLWAGPCAPGPFGGVTQSMLGRYLCCGERFRIAYVLGLQPVPKFEANIEYGNMWHACEEALAGKNDWEKALNAYVKGLATRYPYQRDEIDGWYKKCQAQFPLYVDHWSKHPDVKSRTPLMQEQVFDVPYVLPSGRTVRLRGKFDSVDLIGTGKEAGIYLQENKTKSGIDAEKIRRQLRFDLQTMMYLIALTGGHRLVDSIGRLQWEKRKPPGNSQSSVLANNPILGVRYNVIRRSAHKSVDSMLKKIEEDREEGRIGEWFARWKVEVSAEDIATFKRICLDPVLENLCEDYEWWIQCLQNGTDPFDIEKRIGDWSHGKHHFRFPYGIYNPISEGGFGDVDGYLETGSLVGLRRAETMFTELQ